MTTTAFDDQFTVGTQTIEPVRQLYDTVAILRRNVADLELKLKRQTERATHKGATHCDDCGLTWLDDGLNPLGCPYGKESVPAPAVPATCNDNLQVELRDTLQWMIGQRGKSGHAHRVAGVWDGDNGTKAGKPCAICAMYDKARALLQSAEVQAVDKWQLTPATTHPVDRKAGEVRHD